MTSGHFFNYITTGAFTHIYAFTPVGHLLAPVVKQDFHWIIMNWALLIYMISSD